MARSRAFVLVLAGAGATILVACASERGAAAGERFRPAMVAQGSGVIYLYRRASGGLFEPGPVRVFLDDTSAGRVAAGEYLPLEVEPGEHFVRVEGEGEGVARCPVGAGESFFLRLRAGSMGRVVLDTPEDSLAREQIGESRRARRADP